MAPSIQIVMLGTGDFALPTFEHLIDTGHRVVALVTQPDRPQGRKQELIPSRIKRSAQARQATDSLDEAPQANEVAGPCLHHGRRCADPAARSQREWAEPVRAAVDPEFRAWAPALSLSQLAAQRVRW